MELNRFLDQTLLLPGATENDIERLCLEAIAYHFCAVVVNPVFIPLVSDRLKGSGVKACSVAGFPLGANRTETKVVEACRAVEDGAEEIDVVANIGRLAAGRFAEATKELQAIRRALPESVILKVIIETPVLGPEFWADAVKAVVDSGADFVKTATGFFGVTPVDHVVRLVEYAGGRIKVKAAGGIRTADKAQAMISAGAARIGSSSSVAIVTDSGDNAEK
ncbi:MAG: deoxyribose-phosphate aldolase [candidate division Zixibacteria bacterium]|nr:deoxyribose-phosphate aldolase [candidate division Zixibacteria bacterium]